MERLANTPTLSLPPRRGGLTVGCQPFPAVLWNPKTNQTWENPVSPRTASAERYFGINSSEPHALGQSPGCRGTANFSPKQVLRKPIGSISIGFGSVGKARAPLEFAAQTAKESLHLEVHRTVHLAVLLFDRPAHGIELAAGLDHLLHLNLLAVEALQFVIFGEHYG